MRIRMKTLGAGPAGTWQPGTVLDLDAATGEALVAGGYADAIDGPPAVPPAVEEATAPAGAEQATADPVRKGRRR